MLSKVIGSSLFISCSCLVVGVVSVADIFRAEKFFMGLFLCYVWVFFKIFAVRTFSFCVSYFAVKFYELHGFSV